MPRKTRVIEPAIPARPTRKPSTEGQGVDERVEVNISRSGSSGSGRRESIEDHPFALVDPDALLGHRVALADRDRPVLERVDIHGHAPRRADLVLAAIELADRRPVVVDGHDLAA